MKRLLVCSLAFWRILYCSAQSPSLPDTLPAVDARPALQQEVVVTAQRQPHDNYRLPVVTTVLDRDYLQQRTATSVPEALFGVPGVFLQKTNQGGGNGATEYGSDAIGGVIHVQTHTLQFAEKNSLDADAAFQWLSACRAIFHPPGGSGWS